MYSDVNGSTFSESGETIVDTHDTSEVTHEYLLDASASSNVLDLKATETFSPEGPGLLSPYKSTLDDELKVFPEPESTIKLPEQIEKEERKEFLFRSRELLKQTRRGTLDECIRRLKSWKGKRAELHFLNGRKEVPSKNRRVIGNVSGKEMLERAMNWHELILPFDLGIYASYWDKFCIDSDLEEEAWDVAKKIYGFVLPFNLGGGVCKILA
jgi:hypothetical protein